MKPPVSILLPWAAAHAQSAGRLHALAVRHALGVRPWALMLTMASMGVCPWAWLMTMGPLMMVVVPPALGTTAGATGGGVGAAVDIGGEVSIAVGDVRTGGGAIGAAIQAAALDAAAGGGAAQPLSDSVESLSSANRGES